MTNKCKKRWGTEVRVYLYVLCVLISSCATFESNDVLFDVYTRYKMSATKDNILDTYDQYFSPRLIAEDGRPSESAIPFLLFKNKMEEEGEHFSKIMAQDQGCLTVDGYDNEAGEPIEFNIRYVNAGGVWYIDGTNIRFLESEKEFSKEAICPAKTE